MTTITTHAELTIKRPDGIVETVRAKHTPMTDKLLAMYRKATADAGRGEVLSYTNVTKEVETPAEWDRLAAAEREYDAHQARVYGAMDHYAEGGK